MGINRVSTLRGDVDAFQLTANGHKISVSKVEMLSSLNTQDKLRGRATELFGWPTNDIHFHQNRDGSLAIATGRAPKVWPEDEVS